GRGYAGIASREGKYQIYNLPAGSYTVTAYARGVSYESVEAELYANVDTELELALTGAATGTVTGSVEIANAPGGSMTSVILVIESTFDELLGRGQSVPG